VSAGGQQPNQKTAAPSNVLLGTFVVAWTVFSSFQKPFQTIPTCTFAFNTGRSSHLLCYLYLFNVVYILHCL